LPGNEASIKHIGILFLCSDIRLSQQKDIYTVTGNARHGSVDDMKCYSEKDGSKFQLCQKRLGYRTCFVQYDKDGGIVRRGCSTKNPMFHVECENHVSGIKSEKFCYCSYHLCNYQEKISENFLLLVTTSIFVSRMLSWHTTCPSLLSLLLSIFD